MRPSRLFAAYCALVLLAFTVAKYQGWALFGTSVAAASSSSGGTRGSGGSSGSHK